MEHQDFSKDFHLKLRAEFERIDKFLEKFRRRFIREQLLITNSFLNSITEKDRLEEQLREYANRMFNCADSVADKDENYNEVRLTMELEAISRAVEKYPSSLRQSDIALQTHQKAKELLVHFFPELTELSANGFRLLEKYCLFYNYEFISSLYS
ncbi:hypothetical protein [uncultured Draconibacterium sp.]|uniref:hypothetical protein n=1 Tax=uncultured Draconibacterium sp. TaxID=1573823 RepID=UPI002AA68E26|nr:hypothetical protein [uncultured Draconibacterium sp.]